MGGFKNCYIYFIFFGVLPLSTAISSEEEVLNVCLSGKHHKLLSGPESELFSQCTPWKRRSCCTSNTTVTLHNTGLHKFNFNHCSQVKELSEGCRRHFIQDSCFYECSPNVGPWLVMVNMTVRKQRFYKVPLCRSDCDVWYEACKFDYTCNSNWIYGWVWNSNGNQCPQDSECVTFGEMFRNSTNFCQKVWDDAWNVVPDKTPCMRMWFDGSERNPNDEVAKYYSTHSKTVRNSSYSISHHLHKLSIYLYLGFFGLVMKA